MEYRQAALAAVLRSAGVYCKFVILASALGVVCCVAILAVAQERVPSPGSGESVVITAPKERPSDQEVTKRVQSALDADRYVDASQITVTTQDGVVTVDGIVGDLWTFMRVLRISGRVAGARRVEESLYIPDFDNGP